MAKFQIIMPKLGESIIEATITKWLKQVGDTIGEDDPVVEIATDKVDSEIPSPVEGILIEQLYKEGDVVAVGKVIAVIEVEAEAEVEVEVEVEAEDKVEVEAERSEVPRAERFGIEAEAEVEVEDKVEVSREMALAKGEVPEAGRFLSPLVKNIAKSEGLSGQELAGIQGSGKEGRLTKQDLLSYLEHRRESPKAASDITTKTVPQVVQSPPVTMGSGDQVIEMDRMRRMIADHMVMSKQVSPHVTSFIEADLTRIVKWRETQKNIFEQREGEKLTFTHILFEAAARALRDFPAVNASVDGNKIIIRKQINLGMATLLPNGNLIVPVIRDADQKNIAGMAKAVNDLATRARASQLQPDEIQGGTFTVTNLGSFGSITGTPIINQPQVAILAIGAIRKMPAVVETPDGDMIAIRHKMILALTYDHRVVDGGLGGLYLKKLVEYLENFDANRTA